MNLYQVNIPNHYFLIFPKSYNTYLMFNLTGGDEICCRTLFSQVENHEIAVFDDVDFILREFQFKSYVKIQHEQLLTSSNPHLRTFAKFLIETPQLIINIITSYLKDRRGLYLRLSEFAEELLIFQEYSLQQHISIEDPNLYKIYRQELQLIETKANSLKKINAQIEIIKEELHPLPEEKQTQLRKIFEYSMSLISQVLK